jgi:uncharacterized protein YdeI (YjbR/CyaY-like superfamily)
MSKKNPKVDRFLDDAATWRKEMTELRAIALGCGLTEELKWGKPCYSHEGHNVVIIGPFKEFCALMFCKGALLKDAKGVLAKPGENTQAGRWIKFTAVEAVKKQRSLVKAYIEEAIEAEKSGREIVYKTMADYKVPAELKEKMAADPKFKAAFEALTPGRQRGYLLFFSAAKQSETRKARIEKYRRQIFAGKGMND